MPKEYQLKKHTNYRLPHNLYMRVIYIIRDYDRLKREYESDITEKPRADDGVVPFVTTRHISKPTENKALSLEQKHTEIHAIKNALDLIPREYRNAVMANIIHRRRYPPHAHTRTYSTYRQRLIYYTAKCLGYI